ncbi:DUF882 domain-containing protein [Methylopila sp. M107]|uniref:DUF882 domain-containing protein n=1 Tax=Methylopila sp. M107 TaxID=1101190 RepID=UPI0003A085EC|nr:DUF882 domain-containing protein [Methylopila sp. M107]
MLDAPKSQSPAKRFVKRGLGAVLLGTVALVAGSEATQNAQANGDTRTLTLYHTHRGDTTTVTFKRNGRYDAEGLKQLSNFLRDWRNNKSTRMEPRLFDIVWEVHRQVGRGGMINIVSSYRSPETNAYLRARSNGVAKFSQHMLGRAMDFYVTGVPVSSVREAGIRLQRGGVGFYPTSGRPFVHLDAGNIRAWPRMSRSQLARIFPGGKTVHQPAEGGQMPGYEVALAELKTRGDISLDAAYSGSGGGGRSFFARLFGGADQSDDEAETKVAAAPARGAAATSSSSDDEGGEAAAPVKVATTRVAPLPLSRPADMVRPAAAPAAPAAVQAETVVASVVPMPPIAPARPAQAEMQVATANVPLPPIAPTVVASKPIPMPTPAPSDGFALASAEPAAAPAVPDMAWRTGAQPAKAGPVDASNPGLALASSIPSPRSKSNADSAIAVLAALPTPARANDTPREIDPKAAGAQQAEASSFPRLPDAFLGRRKTEDGEIAMAYAPEATDPALGGAAAQTRAAVAPKTRVTATAPTDPNVRVLSPYMTPAAVYAAATAPMRRRAMLAAPEALVTTPLDEYGYQAFIGSVPVEWSPEMTHPFETASLMVSPSAALVGGFSADLSVGARTDRFAGSSVMLLRTQSFMPSNATASRKVRTQG